MIILTLLSIKKTVPSIAALDFYKNSFDLRQVFFISLNYTYLLQNGYQYDERSNRLIELS